MTTFFRVSRSAATSALIVLTTSSSAPSESTRTLVGSPVSSVIRFMPVVKASITTISPMTMMKATRVSAVVIQRTVRLRSVYFNGTRLTSNSTNTTSAEVPSRSQSCTVESVRIAVVNSFQIPMVYPTRAELADFGKHFRRLDPAGEPRREGAANQGRAAPTAAPQKTALIGMRNVSKKAMGNFNPPKP